MTTKPQATVAPDGTELAVLPRAELDRLADIAEDAADLAAHEAAKAEAAAVVAPAGGEQLEAGGVRPGRMTPAGIGMSIEIRPAAITDIEALVALDSVAAREPRRGGHIGWWVEQGFAVVAADAGQPVGYGVMRDIFFMEPFIELVMVAASHRRRGVGRALVRHLTEQAGAKVWISTNQSNRPMQALIAAEGFAYAGVIEGIDIGDPELFYYCVRPAS